MASLSYSSSREIKISVQVPGQPPASPMGPLPPSPKSPPSPSPSYPIESDSCVELIVISSNDEEIEETVAIGPVAAKIEQPSEVPSAEPLSLH